jgi:general secretion pathway protein D
MNVSGTSFPRRGAMIVAVLLTLVQLAGCSQLSLQTILPKWQSASAPASEASAPVAASSAAPAAAAPAGPASAASATAGDDDDTEPEPVLIRGNDRTVARQPSAQVHTPSGEIARFKFDNAPVGEVVQVMLRDLLKVDYVVHPPLQGTVTLVTQMPIPADRALSLLETALQANGIVMARDSRGVYHVGTPDMLHGIVAAPAIAEPGQPLPPGYGAVVIPLRYIGASEMANILKPIVSQDAILRVDNVRNLLVLRGTRAEAEGWLDMVRTFDVDLLRGMSVGVFPLKYTSTDDVTAALRLLSGATSDAAGGTPRTPGGPGIRPMPPMRPGLPQAAQQAAQAAGLGENNPLFGAIRVMPIDRINAIMVVTPRAAYLDEMRYWIEQFDRPNMNSNEPQLYVYKVKNGSADHLAELLNGIYGGGVLKQQNGGNTGIAPGMNTATGANGNINNSFANNYTNRNNNTMFGNSSFNSGFNNMGGGFNSGMMGGGFNSGIGGGFNGGGMGMMGNMPQNGNNQGPGVTMTMLGTTVQVMADHINNTLLIHSTPKEYERIESTLKRLDVQRAQVLIEASIVEVTLNNDLTYGLEWAFNNNHISINGQRSYTGVGALGSLGTSASSSTSSSSGSSGNTGDAGSTGSTGSSTNGAGNSGNAFTWTLSNRYGVNAVLSALADKSLMKVISSPSLLVLDNQTAAIQVGTQEPVSSGQIISTTSDYSSSSIQYMNTGVMLGVTPSVTAGDLVTMDISQVVSDVGANASVAGQSYPTFMQRQVNTQVAVRSGETVVLGGLIQDTSNSGNSGIPFLSSIPVIGALFGTHNSSAQRTELLVIITPRVLRSDEDARAVSREMRDRMRGLTAGDLPAATAPGTP